MSGALIPKLLLAANTLLVPPGTPLKESQETLRPYFTPQVGSVVTLDPIELINAKAGKYWNVRGYIEVHPPKGVCFTIMRRKDLEDNVVCKRTRLSFTAGDIDKRGDIGWTVSTGTGDFGTEVLWPTPYRLARYVDVTMPWPGPGRGLPILKCEGVKYIESGRHIYLDLLNGERWVLGFPERDTLIPQPEEVPNLMIVQAPTEGSGFVDIKESKESKQKQIQEQYDKGAVWQMHPRNANTMNGSYFMGGGDAPPRGANGECRYKYEGPDDKKTGLMECHNVGKFRWLYMPLACLSAVKP